MKKIFLFIALSLGAMSCDKDVKFNNPAFEAERNYNHHWKATEFKATVVDDSIVIVATAEDETLTIKTSSYDFGSRYNFGEIEQNGAELTSKVIKEDEDGEVVEEKHFTFKTKIGLGRGYVEYAPIEDQVPGTITGKFVVILKETEKDSTVLFSKGVFYRVPME